MSASPRIAPFLVAVACASLGFLPGAQAQPVVINFDGLAAQGSVTDQYASRGVTFNQPTVLDYSVGVLAIPGFAHSGTKAIEQCYAEEFCAVPIQMNFTAPQARVKVWVGRSAASGSRATVFLRGYDGNSRFPVAVASTVLEPSASPTLIRIPLEVESRLAAIRRAVVIGRDEFGNDTIYNIAVDDVEFDTQGPPPPCPATQSPLVTLTHPASGLDTQVKQVLIGGSVSTQALIQEATLTMTGASGSYTMNLLDRVPQSGGSFGPWWAGPIFPGSNTAVVRIRNCF